jgi:FkbM family methyltransferase
MNTKSTLNGIQRIIRFGRYSAALDMSIAARCACLFAYGVFRVPLTRNLARKLGWTIRIRFSDKRSIWIRLGSTDIAVLYEIFARGEYSHHVHEIEQRIDIPKNATIVDLGANIGLAAIYFQQRYPHASLVCVEPEWNNFRCLARNTEGDGVDTRITCVRALIGAGSGVGYLQDENCGEWGFSISRNESAGAEATSILDLRTLLENAGCGDVDVLKCDIEGSEAELMQGIAAWAPHVRALIIELHPALGYGKQRFENDLRTSGYDWTVIDKEDANRPEEQPFVVAAVRAGGAATERI